MGQRKAGQSHMPGALQVSSSAEVTGRSKAGFPASVWECRAGLLRPSMSNFDCYSRVQEYLLTEA